MWKASSPEMCSKFGEARRHQLFSREDGRFLPKLVFTSNSRFAKGEKVDARESKQQGSTT